MNEKELDDYIGEVMRGKRWKAIFTTTEDFIASNGEQFSGAYVWGSNSLKRLRKEIENRTWGGVLYRGYIWKETLDAPPEYLLEHRVDERRNVKTNTLILVPYEDVYHFAGHESKEVDDFALEALKGRYTNFSTLRGREKGKGLFHRLDRCFYAKGLPVYAYWSGSPVELNCAYQVLLSNGARTISLVDPRTQETVKGVKEEDVHRVDEKGRLLLEDGERVTFFAIKPISIQRKDLLGRE